MIADSILPYIANLPAADSSAAVGWAFVVIVVLVVGVESIFKIVDRLKGKKPHSEDLQAFTTKEEHKALSTRVDRLDEESTFQMGATQRALGRIEGELKSLNKHQ